jgi:hypothetical protein
MGDERDSDWKRHIGVPPQAARAARDEGIARSHAGQERKVGGWADEAFEALRLFVTSLSRGATFTSDQARVWIHARTRLAKADEQRAWGHVIRRGVKAGLYVQEGFTQSPDPKQHCAPATLWRKL